MYNPKTGEKCSCKRGVQRDNCPSCEGTGRRIDFAAIRKKADRDAMPLNMPARHMMWNSDE